MTLYSERTYRNRVIAKGMVSFHVMVKETDLWVSANENLEKEAINLVLTCRNQIETYLERDPTFLNALTPHPADNFAPPIVREMADSATTVGVGPMASVAGAISQYVTNGLLSFSEQVIVENGGDIYLKADRPITIAIFAGSSPLSERLGMKIPVNQMPLGVCTSSATVGHSLSLGITDAVCLLSKSAALADGAATALGNRIQKKGDLEKAAAWANHIEGILGGVVILKDQMVTWGEVELVSVHP